MQLKPLALSIMLAIGLGQPVLAADTAKPATEATKAANAAVLKELPFNNKQAFEDSKRGFIAPLENGGLVKNAKGDIVWDLPKFDFLEGDKAEGKTIKLNLDLPDTKDKYLLVVQYGVLQYHKDQQADDADASLTMDRSTLNEIIGGKLKVEQGVTKGSIKLEGDAKKFEEFVSLLDTFDPWYQVVLPMGTK
jgi:alkyl sulfatase BDS1-like metallo-beta-lactamase superfamily hydrolase